MTMIEELAARVFAARDAAHRAHWRTGSYSAHQALGAFYDDVIERIDELVEVYQGLFGLVGVFNVSSEPPPVMLAYLTDEAAWIAAHRGAIAQGATVIENQIDDLLAVYQRTIYKLRFLA